MMLFFTVIFITYFLALLVKGNLFYDLIIKTGEEKIKNAEKGLDSKEIGEEGKKFIYVMFLVLLPMMFTEIIYVLNALTIDYLKYPTILMLLNIIIAFVRIKSTKEVDLTIEENKIKFRENLYKNTKKRTFKGAIIQLINLTYFVYMFYLLVFVVR